MIVYDSFGTLIKDYRQWRGLSQETLAASVKISVRALQRWEANRCHAAIENLHDFSEVTGIPMQVCVALNAGQPVRYMMHNRRFAFSPLETEQISVHQLLRHREVPEDGFFLKSDRITTEKQIAMVLSCHRDIYGAEHDLPKDTLRAACRILPDLNLVAFDRWGHYVGHFVCLPVSTDTYRRLKEGRSTYAFPKAADICDITAQGEGVFLYYSLFAPSASVAYLNMMTGIRYLGKIERNKGFMVVFHSAAIGAEEFFINLGMRKAFENKGGREQHNKQVHPIMYEIELELLMKPMGPFGVLGWLAEEFGRKPKERPLDDADGETSVDFSPPYTYEAKSITPAQDQGLPFEKAISVDPFFVGGAKDAVCPNPKCLIYNKPQAGNIICNGQYRTKKGILSQRFMCKKCGKSFCSNADSLFYDLRHSQEKVLMAFKLLAKGMPLRSVAEVLGVKLDTVRHWLQLAADQSEKIEALLREQIKISPAKLNALWSFAKSNTLRHRAALWNQKKD